MINMRLDTWYMMYDLCCVIFDIWCKAYMWYLWHMWYTLYIIKQDFCIIIISLSLSLALYLYIVKIAGPCGLFWIETGPRISETCKHQQPSSILMKKLTLRGSCKKWQLESVVQTVSGTRFITCSWGIPVNYLKRSHFPMRQPSNDGVSPQNHPRLWNRMAVGGISWEDHALPHAGTIRWGV